MIGLLDNPRGGTLAPNGLLTVEELVVVTFDIFINVSTNVCGPSNTLITYTPYKIS